MIEGATFPVYSITFLSSHYIINYSALEHSIFIQLADSLAVWSTSCLAKTQTAQYAAGDKTLQLANFARLMLHTLRIESSSPMTINQS